MKQTNWLIQACIPKSRQEQAMSSLKAHGVAIHDLVVEVRQHEDTPFIQFCFPVEEEQALSLMGVLAHAAQGDRPKAVKIFLLNPSTSATLA